MLYEVITAVLKRAGVGGGHGFEDSFFPLRIIDGHLPFFLDLADLQRQAGALVEDPQQLTVQTVDLDTRITSYNVCYTKLLRVQASTLSVDAVFFVDGKNFGGKVDIDGEVGNS